MKSKASPSERPSIPPVISPGPAKNQAWGGFWRAILAVAIGFLLPMLGCSGLILVSVVGLQAAALAAPSAAAPSVRGPASGPAVGVIRVVGVLQSESDPLNYSSVASSEDLVDLIDRAAADADVKALVLAVNSPGGSVVASDVIHHALQGLDKPVVVTMGEVAASGGYYISAGADWIIANPSTLTGSIGVISQFPNAEGLLEKVGVDFVVITSGPRKDFGSPYREMTAAERRYWQSMVDEIYDGFVQVVVEGRGLAEEDVRKIADGSVYTGRQALELGLIDALGYEEDAIAKAAELGGIEGEPRVLEYSAPPGIFDLFRYALQRGSLPSLSEVVTWIGHPSVAARWMGP
jgi:protease-4